MLLHNQVMFYKIAPIAKFSNSKISDVLFSNPRGYQKLYIYPKILGRQIFGR